MTGATEEMETQGRKLKEAAKDKTGEVLQKKGSRCRRG